MQTNETVTGRQRELERQQQAFVRATVVRTERPTSARAGDTAVVDALGVMTGFVGGTCVEASVREYSLQVLEREEPLLLQVRPGEPGARQLEGAVEVHNPCLSGGSVDIFLEPVVPAPHLVVVGEHPVAQALARLGAALGYRMEVADGADWEPGDGIAGVIVAAHGKGEEPALERALTAGIPYIGLVASDKRGPAVVASLEVDDALRARVRTPAGMKLGGDRPEEIALGILAEFVQARASGGGIIAAPRGDAGHGGNAKHDSHAGDDAHAGHDAHDGHGPHDAPHEYRPPAGPQTNGPVTAIDPVCGMTVIAAPPTLHVEHEGRSVWFCGESCRRAFRKEPERYATGV